MINNHNKLLYNYPGTIGVKNGYTVAANRTFIAAVTRGGQTYLFTEMYGLDVSWRPQAAMSTGRSPTAPRPAPVGELVAAGQRPAPPRRPRASTGPAGPLDRPGRRGPRRGRRRGGPAASPAHAALRVPAQHRRHGRGRRRRLAARCCGRCWSPDGPSCAGGSRPRRKSRPFA